MHFDRTGEHNVMIDAEGADAERAEAGAGRSGPGQRAISVARDSRTTVTRIWPG